MAKLGIVTGTVPDDGTGDTLLGGAIKINSNFDEVYTFLGDGTNLNVGVWNKTSVGINTTLSVGIGTTNPTNTLTVRGGDISVGVNTDHGLVLTSPNGTKYRLIVDDAGVLSTVLVP